mmetsp:Transcript_29278/g.93679  ORF Transcript_29278/g.93679 Transcript_29278/m.93679 type:complete len:260 (+) Transcript_29278:175-954(+)
MNEMSMGDDPNAMFAGAKKKKKKKKESDLEDMGEAAPAPSGDAPAGDDAGADDLGSFDLSMMKKKKKKKKAVDVDGLDEGAEEEDDAAASSGKGSGLPWEGSDRDYTYDELLNRVFGILRENNPELTGEKRRTIMKPPQVLREGTKKTVFVNFMELCKTMHRQPDHVQAFLLAELGTSGSLDGQQRLIVKGRFLPKVFEGILRRYVTEYVLCNMCKSPDTILNRENRLYFLRCEQCGASSTVAPIKAGFVARVGRRPRT